MSRTQLRLAQITGSFKNAEGGIIDTLPLQTAGLAGLTVNSGSLVGVFSEIASAVKRINGGTTFAGTGAGILQDQNQDVRIKYVNGEPTHISDNTAQKLSIYVNGAVLTGSFLPDADVSYDLGSASKKWDQVHAAGVSGSLNATNIGANQVAHANATSTLVGDANFTFDGTTLTLGASQDLLVGRDATINGNLTVNGATTTIDSANLVIEDRVILIGSGATASSSVSAIAFASGSATAERALVFGPVGADDVLAAGRADVIDGTTTAYGSLFNDLVKIRASEYQVMDENKALKEDAGNLVLSASGNPGDALFFVAHNGSAAEGVRFATGSADAQNAFLNIYRDPAIGPVLNFDNAGSGNTVIDHQLGGDLILSGNIVRIQSTPVDDAADAPELRFYSGSKYVSLNAPSLNSNVGLVLPSNTGFANEVLITDGSGVLSFAPAPSSANANKAVLKVRAGVQIAPHAILPTTASATLSENTLLQVVGTNNGTVAAQVNDIPDADKFGLVDVFVNGQLLTSGAISSNEVQGDADYGIDNYTANDLNLRFAFALEADDIITVITK